MHGIDIDRRQQRPDTLVLNGTSLTLGDTEIRLSSREAALTNVLLLHFGKVVKRHHLHDELYQLDPNGGPDEKIICVYVSKIRAKIAAAKMSLRLHTHWGVGYELRNPVA